MKEAYISIGSNLGEREDMILRALTALHGESGVTVTKISNFYATKAWGNTNQPDFINAAAKILTDKTPEALLEILLKTEQKLGRKRLEHWGSRTVDVDLIHFEGVAMDTEKLKLPHPFFDKRNFVLVPLAEIASSLIINEKSVKNHLIDCMDKLPVRKTSAVDFDISLIAAVDAGFGIGKNGNLLYKVSEDMKYFRETTMGGVVVVGRKTFENMGNLPGRNIVVMTKKDYFNDQSVKTATSVAELFRLLKNYRNKKIFIAGGAEIFKALTPYARKAFITHILDKREADVFMPVLYDFKLKTARFTEDKKTKFAFATYEKK